MGELANLTVSDLNEDILHVYRKKTDLGQDGKVGTRDGLSIRRIQQIIVDIGVAASIQGHLNPHDLRHNWATRAGKNNDIHILMQAGVWSSMAMPLRYMDADKIANDQLKMDK